MPATATLICLASLMEAAVFRSISITLDIAPDSGSFVWPEDGVSNDGKVKSKKSAHIPLTLPSLETPSSDLNQDMEIQMIHFEVPGMTCGGCARSITAAIQAADAEAKVEIDIPARRVSVESRLNSGSFIVAIREAGYEARTA